MNLKTNLFVWALLLCSTIIQAQEYPIENKISCSSSERILSAIGSYKGKSYVFTERSDDQYIRIFDESAQELTKIDLEIKEISGNVESGNLMIIKDELHFIFSIYDRKEKKDNLYDIVINTEKFSKSAPRKIVSFPVDIAAQSKFIVKKNELNDGLIVGYMPDIARSNDLWFLFSNLDSELNEIQHIEELISEKNSLTEVRDFGCDKEGNIFVYAVEFSNAIKYREDEWDNIDDFKNWIYVYPKGGSSRKVLLNTGDILLAEMKIVSSEQGCILVGAVSRTHTKNFDGFVSIPLNKESQEFDIIQYNIAEQFIDYAEEKAFFSYGNRSSKSKSYKAIYNYELQFARVQEGDVYLILEEIKFDEEVRDSKKNWAYGYSRLEIYQNMRFRKTGNLIWVKINGGTPEFSIKIVEKGFVDKRGMRTYPGKCGMLFDGNTHKAAYIEDDKACVFDILSNDVPKKLTFDPGFVDWSIANENYSDNTLFIVGKKSSKLYVKYLKY